MLQESLDVLAAVKTKGILDKVQVQSPTLSVDHEVITVWGELDRLNYRMEVCQFYVVGDCEGLLRLLRAAKMNRKGETGQYCDRDSRDFEMSFGQGNFPQGDLKPLHFLLGQLIPVSVENHAEERYVCRLCRPLQTSTNQKINFSANCIERGPPVW
jgi:hypothetical protein